MRLSDEGICLEKTGIAERLTNIRYAADLILFSKSLCECQHMLESLVDVLYEYGLELNVNKTKILSTEVAHEDKTYLITDHGAVEIVAAKSKHKYLGRGFCGELRNRGAAAIEHRLTCAWMKYGMLKHVFEDKHLSMQLRLKLFDSVITSTLVYSLETCPLTESMCTRLDGVQRKMLRRMVGWIIQPEDTWETGGRRMKHRLEYHLEKFGMKDWSMVVSNRKKKINALVDDWPSWMQYAIYWHPPDCNYFNMFVGRRFRGRPRTRWNDAMMG